MKNNGAFLTVYALEQIGVRKTFGIPGIHNTEIYNQISNSKVLEPVLVTHELSAGFMADAVSRTTNSIGTIVIVPGAGLTHSMSSIAEASIDGIPMLIISGGTQRSPGRSFHMHRLNIRNLLDGIVKKYYYIDEDSDIIQTIYDAFEVATGGEPGPVCIEIPSEIQVAEFEFDHLHPYKKSDHVHHVKSETGQSIQLFATMESPEIRMNRAITMLSNAKYPGIYVGWGAVDAFDEIKQVAEMLKSPVSTTLQGVSSFPYSHPLHTGIGFGPNSTQAGQNAFKNCDCLLAIGVKFSELATFNYQMDVPENLVHIDINPDVFHKNYHAAVALEGDSKIILTEIINGLKNATIQSKNSVPELSSAIKKDKDEYKKTWLVKASDELVTPGFFFFALRNNYSDDVIIVTDDGNHSLLAMELFPVNKPRHFICPTDFNCMGYGIPAAIGAKLLNMQKNVIAVIGHSALLMTGLELVTAHCNKLGIVVFVFRESENETVANNNKNQANSAPVTRVGMLSVKGLADAVHAEYFAMKNDIDISGVILKAKESAKQGKPVLVEVFIDYSRKPKLAGCMIKPKSSRFRLAEKLKMFFRKTGESEQM